MKKASKFEANLITIGGVTSMLMIANLPLAFTFFVLGGTTAGLYIVNKRGTSNEKK